MNWRPARNAAPPSVEDLTEGLAKAEADHAALEAEAAEIVEAQPNLAADPERASAARQRLADLEALIPVARRTVESIRLAIPLAENRERETALRTEMAERRKESDALGRDARSRFEKAAGALAAVLAEIERDNHAWEILNLKGREFGLAPETSAEKRLRGEIGMRPGVGWCSLAEDIVVRDWSGRVLFGGTVGGYC
jgi:hypothetical protein